MNNQSPLIPQGSLQEQKNKGRARVRFAVFVVLGIHGIGLLALLIVGCKDETKQAQSQTAQITNTSPAFDSANAAVTPTPEPSAPATPTGPTASAAATPATASSPGSPTATAEQPAASLTAPASGATEYKIAAGDNFSTLAKKFHVTSKAIVEANPGVEPTKLKVGQTVHIPASTPATAPAVAAAATAATDSSGNPTYKVKSGDNLIKIASEKKVSLKALRAANNLTTDRIKVGQVLKIPAKTTTSTTPASASATPVSGGMSLASATPSTGYAH
jgi:LysM repeat protein